MTSPLNRFALFAMRHYGLVNMLQSLLLPGLVKGETGRKVTVIVIYADTVAADI
jgi:hypothetical protein